MRSYLACTVRGDRAAMPVLREILARLQHRGHEVFTAHLLTFGYPDAADVRAFIEAHFSASAVQESEVT